MLSRFIAFTLLMSVSAFAADDCSQTAIDQGVIRNLTRVSSRLNVECPNQLNAQDFCSSVEGQTIETEPMHDSILYTYQTQIYRASCIEASDDEATIRAKIQNFWNRYHDSLTCNQFNFNPRNGSILKLAVARKSDPFINHAVSVWRVDLNHVDTVDQMTVLDYIAARRSEAAPGSTLYRTLDQYYKTFRDAGAKLKREL